MKSEGTKESRSDQEEGKCKICCFVGYYIQVSFCYFYSFIIFYLILGCKTILQNISSELNSSPTYRFIVYTVQIIF